MESSKLPSSRDVYLNCRPIFVGLETRKRKRILQLLVKKRDSIKRLTKDYSLESIAFVAHNLVNERIFENLNLAKLRFPDLVQLPTVQVTGKSVSEAKVLRSGTQAIRDLKMAEKVERNGAHVAEANPGIVSTMVPYGSMSPSASGATMEHAGLRRSTRLANKHLPAGSIHGPPKIVRDEKENHPNSEGAYPQNFHSGIPVRFNNGFTPVNNYSAQPMRHNSLTGNFLTRLESQVSIFPNLHPIFLPYRTQHKILVSVQTLLEECCFEFGQKWAPELMKINSWHETESVELTRWTQIFSRNSAGIPDTAFKLTLGSSVGQIMNAVSALRHTAVHRSRTSAAGIISMLDAANNFAEALNDPVKAAKIRHINRKLKDCVESITKHQTPLLSKWNNELADIRRRKAELDILEKSKIDDMLTTANTDREKFGRRVESLLDEPYLFGPSQSLPNNKASNGPEKGSQQSPISIDDESDEEMDLARNTTPSSVHAEDGSAKENEKPSAPVVLGASPLSKKRRAESALEGHVDKARRLPLDRLTTIASVQPNKTNAASKDPKADSQLAQKDHPAKFGPLKMLANQLKVSLSPEPSPPNAQPFLPRHPSLPPRPPTPQQTTISLKIINSAYQLIKPPFTLTLTEDYCCTEDTILRHAASHCAALPWNKVSAQWRGNVVRLVSLETEARTIDLERVDPEQQDLVGLVAGARKAGGDFVPEFTVRVTTV